MLELHRRLQMAHMTCDPATFGADAAAADDACCDSDNCQDGTPGSCDAKCAVVFNDFYDRCRRFLEAQSDPDVVVTYDRLYATCTAALPVEPLLRAVAVCNNTGTHSEMAGQTDVPLATTWAVAPGRFAVGPAAMSWDEAKTYYETTYPGGGMASVHSFAEQRQAASACAGADLGSGWSNTTKAMGCWIGLLSFHWRSLSIAVETPAKGRGGCSRMAVSPTAPSASIAAP